ncbi:MULTISPECIES: monovalent cation/H+ antiporter complex subunit F [Auritidibacter]|uniref:monovalent cation/H+ antiporter complex subunit F n=1 Tax=Auritidibacter TaxID=1160973 RepID=UPI000D72A343|nr:MULTISPECIES: monovalent cation/H+ antiporter complex subunit F [Auritidibacter]PXA79649.1 sodium:proton antiporter [Auritidibacter sp. NML120779]AXR74854.1 sodium:proton antiporter [Auritidibacter sp. NML130574]NIH71270.1 multisubunit Na+/H+ antiporter MnhF subunit [Auritidibacter ignavus]PXA78304.1 sodium:proton antiporter [Auritidibacter sp. NML100628]RMX23548.1 sodium:proton antiporter [Auritidibacter ignavus]
MHVLQLAGWICLVFLAIGALASVYRIARGPATLDRAIATDVLLITVSSALVVIMALTGLTDYIMFVVVASVIGFVGSVTLSRFTVDGTTANPGASEERLESQDHKDTYVGHAQGPGRRASKIGPQQSKPQQGKGE